MNEGEYPVKFRKDRETGRKVHYVSADTYLVRDLHLDKTALRQVFRGEVPEVVEFVLRVPRVETEEERRDREKKKLSFQVDKELRRRGLS